MSGFLDFKMGVFHRPDAVEEFLGYVVELFFGRGKLTMDAKKSLVAIAFVKSWTTTLMEERPTPKRCARVRKSSSAKNHSEFFRRMNGVSHDRFFEDGGID